MNVRTANVSERRKRKSNVGAVLHELRKRTGSKSKASIKCSTANTGLPGLVFCPVRRPCHCTDGAEEEFESLQNQDRSRAHTSANHSRAHSLFCALRRVVPNRRSRARLFRQKSLRREASTLRIMVVHTDNRGCSRRVRRLLCYWCSSCPVFIERRGPCQRARFLLSSAKPDADRNGCNPNIRPGLSHV